MLGCNGLGTKPEQASIRLLINPQGMLVFKHLERHGRTIG